MSTAIIRKVTKEEREAAIFIIGLDAAFGVRGFPKAYPRRVFNNALSVALAIAGKVGKVGRVGTEDFQRLKVMVKVANDLGYETVRPVGTSALRELNARAQSLLLFLETRAVDYMGRVDTDHMNKEEMAIAKQWSEEGFISFGRIVFDDVTTSGSHWVELSPEAWEVAASLRQAKGVRTWAKRRFKTTTEKREGVC